MKKSYAIIIPAWMMMAFFASCSRQIACIGTASKMQTVSLPQNQRVLHEALPVANCAVRTNEKCLPAPIAEVTNQPVSGIKTPPGGLVKIKNIQNFVTNKGKTAVKAVLKYASSVGSAANPETDYDYPQINKAGFILIGAGILAFILHLIIYACIALVLLGLFILLSPLFHKRY